MNWWPFRTPSPREEYSEPEPESFETRVETIPLAHGVLRKEVRHICRPPSQKDLPPGIKLEPGDEWTCPCGKTQYQGQYGAWTK